MLVSVATPRPSAEIENRVPAGRRHDADNIKPFLAVTGLAIEARIAAGPGVEVVCSGCDPARLHRLLHGLTPTRYRAVISFGLSGALDPALRPGDIVVATEIKSDAGDWPMATMLSGAVTDRLRDVGNTTTRAALAGVDAPVIAATNKADLWKRTGAAAVDMESHVAASFGAAVGLPVCALRVISDPAARNLPPVAARALTADGRVDLAAIVAGVAGNPKQIPLLIQAGRDARVAFSALRRVRRLLEFGLGFGSANL